jgi:hypothetical protein
MVRFLPDPRSIRSAIHRLQRSSDRLDLAVAFIGADWQEILHTFKGRIRIICWLSSTNTNPYAVKNLMNRKDTFVRQRDGMHCKAYIAATAAVVGSANLSGRALSESDNAGQDEAAVLIEGNVACHRQLSRWFDDLWANSGTRPIGRSDIQAAQSAFDAARNQRRGSIRASTQSRVPPRARNLPKSLSKWAAKVRYTDILDDIGENCELFQALTPSRMTKVDQRNILTRRSRNQTGKSVTMPGWASSC